MSQPGFDFSRHQQLIPKVGGVYLFYSGEKQLLYVGKANNLRRRISQHLTNSSTTESTRIQAMHPSIASIAWVYAPSELHALLLEDVLIKKHMPIYNKQQKKMGLQVWLTIDKTKSPTLRLLESPPEGNTKEWIYGPFKDRFFAELLAEVLKNYYGIQTALRYSGRGKRTKRVVSGNTFGRLEQLYAPANSIAAAGRFLEGDDDPFLTFLESEMTRFTEIKAFEAAARARDTLLFCTNFVKRQQFYRKFRNQQLIILEHEGEKNGYVFVCGQLLTFHGHYSSCWSSWLGYNGATVNHDSLLFDRAALVYRWLHKTGSKRTGIFDTSGS